MTLTPLRVAGVPEHFNLPWHLGIENGAFRKAGIELEWQTVPQGTGAMCDLLRKGQTDLAILVTDGAVRDILNGNPSRIVSSYVDSPLNWGVYVGVGTALHKPEDLVGLPFAISRYNSGSHLIAMNYARSLGWMPKKENFIVVNDLFGAEERMRTDEPMAFLWEVATTSPWAEQGLFRKVDEFRPPWPCFMVVATEQALKEKGAEVHRALAVVRQQAALLKTRADAAELIAQRQVISLPAANEWLSEVRWNMDGTVNNDALFNVATALRELGLIDGSPTKEELVRRLVV